jgi:hypothetical protein
MPSILGAAVQLGNHRNAIVQPTDGFTYRQQPQVKQSAMVARHPAIAIDKLELQTKDK